MTADGATLEVDLRVERPGGFALDVQLRAPPGHHHPLRPVGLGQEHDARGHRRPRRADARARRARRRRLVRRRARRATAPVERRGIAFVFQSLALFPHMTALGNVEYGMPRAMPRAERAARAPPCSTRMQRRAPRRPQAGDLLRRRGAARGARARLRARARGWCSSTSPSRRWTARCARDFVADVRAWVAETRVPLVHVTHHRNEARALGRSRGRCSTADVSSPSARWTSSSRRTSSTIRSCWG